MLRLVVGVGGAGPVDEVEVDIVRAETLEGGINTLLHTVVPGVVELGGDPDLATRHTGVSDSGTNFGLVTIGKGTRVSVSTDSVPVCVHHENGDLRVNVTVTLQKGVLDGLADLIGLGLPGTKTDSGNLVPGVESVDLPASWRANWLVPHFHRSNLWVCKRSGMVGHTWCVRVWTF